jgi:hypothetical protein
LHFGAFVATTSRVYELGLGALQLVQIVVAFSNEPNNGFFGDLIGIQTRLSDSMIGCRLLIQQRCKCLVGDSV